MFSFFGKKKDKGALFKNITRGVDPLTHWKMIAELGEGTFGVVHKVCKLRVHVLSLTCCRLRTSRQRKLPQPRSFQSSTRRISRTLSLRYG